MGKPSEQHSRHHETQKKKHFLHLFPFWQPVYRLHVCSLTCFMSSFALLPSPLLQLTALAGQSLPVSIGSVLVSLSVSLFFFYLISALSSCRCIFFYIVFTADISFPGLNWEQQKKKNPSKLRKEISMHILHRMKTFNHHIFTHSITSIYYIELDMLCQLLQ